MQRGALLAVLIGLCIFSIPGSAQGPAVQLCVAGMQVAGSSASDTVGRELLIKFLNKEKPDKALPIENVPIPPAVPEDALAFSKQKGCDYLVTTNQTEVHSDSSWGSGPGATSLNIQTFFVTTAYRLTKVSDGAEMSSGPIKASDKGSEQNAIGFTMKKIADKVTEAIRKAGPIAK
jgi:hypothetical protein